MNPRIAIPVGLALGLVALAFAFAAGRRSNGAPVAAVDPVAAERAENARTTERLNREMAAAQAAREATTPPPDSVRAPAPPTDAQLASNIAGLTGEPLIAALWLVDQAATGQPTYAQLQRNADRYAGHAAVFTGEVMEIQDVPDGGSFLRLAVQDDYERVVAVFTYVAPADDIAAHSHVRAYGALAGSFSYTSQANWEITIPRLNAVAVVRSSVPRRAPHSFVTHSDGTAPQ